MFRFGFKVSAALTALSFALPTEAAVLYRYDAAPYIYYAGNGPGNQTVFPITSGVSLEFEAAAPLAGLSALTNVTAQVLSWRYTGLHAVTTVSSATPGASLGINVITDAAGKIVQHIFSVAGSLQGSGFAVAGGSFSHFSTNYDQTLVHPGPEYAPRLGLTIRGIPFFCGPPCSEYGYNNLNLSTWQAPRQIASGGGAVPEPASWALMIAGFGLVGAAIRRGRVGFALAQT